MKVVIAHPFPDLYGSDRMLVEAIKGMQEQSMDVTVVVPEHGPLLPRLASMGVQVEIVEVPVLRKKLLSSLGLARLIAGFPRAIGQVRRTLRRLSPDVVYVNTITLPHWIFGARSLKIPVVCHIHELQDGLRPAISRILHAPLRLSDQVVAVSEATKAFVVKNCPTAAGRTTVVLNGVHLPESLNVPGSLPSRLRLGIVGRLTPGKGQDVAIKAVKALAESGHESELHFAGSVFQGYEWYETHLHHLAADLDLEDRVTFHGYVEDVWRFYRDIDVVLMPSHAESCPLAAIEALSVPRPLVGARVGGLVEIVRDGVTGTLVAPNDPEALAQGVRLLIADPGAVEKMTAASALDVRERFDVRRFRHEIANVVASVIESAKAVKEQSCA